ncbi:MAG TPA: FlgO family outer membrane protein [Longimicrobiaceae bacterium]|nr:FlgO family outer membrane protein [Longimicrobiaceae bacterium]
MLRRTTALSTALLAVLVATGTAVAQAPDTAQTHTVAVLDFDNNSGKPDYDSLGKGIAAMMVTDLSNVQGIQLVERQHLHDLVDELNLQQTQYVDSATAGKIGRLAGADYVVVGSLTAIDPRMRIDTRVLRVQTGEIVKTAQVQGDQDRFFELERKLSNELIDGLQISLSPEDRQRLAAEQEANRIDRLQTALAFSQALDFFERKQYVQALGRMHVVMETNPGSPMTQLLYQQIEQKAKDSAAQRVRRGLGGLLRRATGD